MATESLIPQLRPDIVGVPTTPRPTAAPVRVHFAEVLGGGAQAIVQGAQAAVRLIPGAPVMALSLRGGAVASIAAPAAPVPSASVASAGAAGMAPEGPLAAGSGSSIVGPGSGAGNIEGSMEQAQEMNLYFLQIQEQVNAQSRTFTALSNILEAEHNTAKTAIGNIH